MFYRRALKWEESREYSLMVVYTILFEGATIWYTFKKGRLKKQLLNIITESKEIMNFEINGFVIMDNHYH